MTNQQKKMSRPTASDGPGGDKKSRRAALLLIVMAVVVVLGIVVLVISTRKKHQAEDEEKAMVERVEGHRDKAFRNKWFGDEELTDQDEKYIENLLTTERKAYEDRMVNILIDGNEYTLSMENLKENIYFVCLEGDGENVYPAGRESALAQHIINVDKDLPVNEQDDIISGKRQTKKVTVELRCESNQERITSLVAKYAKKYDKPPKNATIDKNMKVKEEKNGQVLDTSRIAEDLKDYLDSDETADFSEKYETKVVEAQVKASYLKKIDTPIGSFSTYFIPTNVRGKNIALAASRIDGKLLKPEEEVSFLEALYDDSDGKSYGKAGGFLNNKVVQVEGGGICQVSITAYDAFLLAGIIPTQRFPHMCMVSYVPAGMDAALAVGTKDLVVKNTLEYPLLIRAKTNSGKLQVSIYSYKKAKDGKTYKMRAESEKGSLTVDSYLDVYKGKTKLESIHLATDTYKKLK
ncbi:MAG: VanW family protein [Eubacterium sp.]|nr:VanW family protein [Eubacterium sp.]